MDTIQFLLKIGVSPEDVAEFKKESDRDYQIMFARMRQRLSEHESDLKETNARFKENVESLSKARPTPIYPSSEKDTFPMENYDRQGKSTVVSGGQTVDTGLNQLTSLTPEPQQGDNDLIWHDRSIDFSFDAGSDYIEDVE